MRQLTILLFCSSLGACKSLGEKALIDNRFTAGTAYQVVDARKNNARWYTTVRSLVLRRDRYIDVRVDLAREFAFGRSGGWTWRMSMGAPGTVLHTQSVSSAATFVATNAEKVDQQFSAAVQSAQSVFNGNLPPLFFEVILTPRIGSYRTQITRDSIDGITIPILRPHAPHNDDSVFNVWMIDLIETAVHEYYHALVALELVPKPKNTHSEEAIAYLIAICASYPVVSAEMSLIIRIDEPAGPGPMTLKQSIKNEPIGSADQRIARLQLRQWLGASQIARGDQAAVDRLLKFCRAAIYEAPDLTTGYFTPRFE